MDDKESERLHKDCWRREGGSYSGWRQHEKESVAEGGEGQGRGGTSQSAHEAKRNRGKENKYKLGRDKYNQRQRKTTTHPMKEGRRWAKDEVNR